MRRLSIWCRIYLGLAAFSVLGTALSTYGHLDPGPIKPLAALVTLLVGVVAVFEPIFAEMGRKKGFLCFGAVFLIGATAEVVGIYTGLPFGRYEYTNHWWPTILLPGGLYFPLLVPFAWALVVGGSFYRGFMFPRPIFAVAIAYGALWATFVDFTTERVMVEDLHYWRWLEPVKLAGAPPINYLGWLLTSALALSVLWLLGARPSKRAEPFIVACAHVSMLLFIALIGMSVH